MWITRVAKHFDGRNVMADMSQVNHFFPFARLCFIIFHRFTKNCCLLIIQGAIVAERQEILAELVQMNENQAALPVNIADIVK